LLAPLARLAARHRVAVLAVMHLNKDQQQRALYRTSGSVAFAALARMVFALAFDPNDAGRRLFVPIKSNPTAPVLGLASSIDGSGLRWAPGTVEIDADTLLGKTIGKRPMECGTACG
jgi:putative DNA primase/helicase